MAENQPGLLERYFADFLASRSGLADKERKQFHDIVVRLSVALDHGHTCIPVEAPDLKLLQPLPLVADCTADREGTVAPLVICDYKLYLHRYYRYERRLAEQILSMSKEPSAVTKGAARSVAEMLERLFPPGTQGPGDTKDYQKEAAVMALQKTFLVISGGPGTGKTTTVAKILALLVAAEDKSKRPAIGLAAPTGKAAMRLSESIGRSLLQLELPGEIERVIPATACTLHRLLGVRRHSPQFVYNQDNPMGWDVVVVDEASMVDLAMMSKLVDALKPGARLILLGDRDQLASVESGTVLSDFVESLSDNSVNLRKSYRFDHNIRQVATGINEADSDRVLQLLDDPAVENVSRPGPDIVGYAGKRYAHYMRRVMGAAAKIAPEHADIKKIFKSFQEFQVLCAVHFGERGVYSMNRNIERNLGARGYVCQSDTWYPGRPVLITRNDYNLGLFNGDIGICLPDPKDGSARVWFEKADGGLQNYIPNRLPPHETVFAMTIHKSQGSEFNEVVVLLPEEDSRILSRELVYTGVTRARKVVRLAAEEDVLALALKRNVRRYSGLRGFLNSRQQY